MISERPFTYHPAMLFAVVKLRSKGRRLTRAEIDAQPRAIGDLHFCAPPQSMDPARPRDPLKRPTRVAELRGVAIGGIEHTLIASLMEPVVVAVTKEAMVIFGYEMAHAPAVPGERAALHEYTQGWLVRHVAPGEQTMRRGDVPM